MSTATAPSKPPAKGRSDSLIEDRLAEACRALWWAEVVRAGLRLAIAVVAALLVWAVVDHWLASPGPVVRLAAFAVLVGGSAWYLVRRIVPLIGSSIRPEYAARALERDLPEMRQSLTSYVTLRDGSEQAGLRGNVVRSIGAQAAAWLRGHDALPAEATGTLRFWLATAAALGLFLAYAAWSPKNTGQSLARLAAPLAEIEPPRRVAIADVRPGDADAMAGREVEVSARVAGLREDETVWCRWQAEGGPQQRALQLDASTGRYAAALPLDYSASGTVPYKIVAGDATAGPYRLNVRDVPVVAVGSVRYEPPAYTGERPHASSNGTISAVEGTLVTLTARTNRPVERAQIEFNPRSLGGEVRATAGVRPMQLDSDGTGLSATFRLESASGRAGAVGRSSYRIKAWDEAGQSNPEPIVYPIRVTEDLPPEVAIVLPQQTPKEVPIDAQQIIEVHAMDPDYGLQHIGLKIRRGIDAVAEPTLWQQESGAKGNQVAEYRFRPAELGLRVGDVVEVRAIATDNRAIPSEPSVEANEAATDPIELKISQGGAPPPADPAGGRDGLSPPDDQPANPQEQQEQQEQTESSESEQQGEQDQASEGESGDDQSGEGQAAEGESGQGQQGEGQQGQGQQGQGRQGEGQQGQGQQGQGQQGGQGQQNDQGQQGGQGQQGEGEPGSQQQGQAGGEDQGQPGQQSQDGAGEDQSGASPAGRDQQGQPSSAPGSAGDEPGSASGQPGEMGQQGQPGQQGGEAGASGGDASSQPPEHDGEAFERIRDYLNEKRRDGQDSPGESEAPGEQGQPGGQGQSGEQGQSGGEQGQQEPQGQEPQPGASQGESGGDSPAGDRRPDPGQGDPRDGEPRSGEETGRGDQPGPSDRAGQQPERSSDPGQSSERTGQPDEPQAESGGQPGDAGDPRGDDGSPGGEQGQQEGQGQQDQRSQQGEQTPGGQPAQQGQQGAPSQPGERGEQGQQGGQEEPGEQGDRGQPDQPAGEADQPSRDAGQPGEEDSADGSSAQGDSSGESPDGGGQRGDNGPGGSQADGDSQAAGGDQPQPGEQPAGGDQPRDGGGEPSGSGEPSDSGQAAGRSQPGQQPATRGGSGSAAGTADGGDPGSAPPAPDPVDPEYAKEATDMVLDYLEETRETPDRELLDRLDWSEEDLQRFTERWQRLRESDPAAEPGAGGDRLSEALRSLGLRPPAGDAAPVQRDAGSDSLRGLRDAGNRQPPPPAYRDAFEAFRRSIGRPE